MESASPAPSPNLGHEPVTERLDRPDKRLRFPKLRGPKRPSGVLLVTALVAALLGGGVASGVLLASGAVDGSTELTRVVQPIASSGAPSGGSGGSESASSLDASAIYASSSAGVVDIAARSDSRGSSGFPFDPGGASQSVASGSGFVIDDEGHILTAAHVVDGASSISVRFEDGTTSKATVVGRDESNDVALLKVDPSGLTLHPLALGSSDSLQVGDAVAVIGDPFGYERSLSTGVVSGVDRTIESSNGFSIDHAIQTDAALNSGNSGGPVLDSNGRVVGIAEQIATGGSGSSTSSGVGFAVPIDVVKSELSQLKSGGEVEHAYLGVSVSDASGNDGALVQSVQSGGPAAEAGLRRGDRITAVDGNAVQSSDDLVAAINSQKPGDRVTLSVERGSQHLRLEADLTAQPAQAS
jgi:putative serine protease PepD